MKGDVTKEDKAQVTGANWHSPELAIPTRDNYDRQDPRESFLLKFSITRCSLSIFYRRAFAPGPETKAEGEPCLTDCWGRETQIQLAVIPFGRTVSVLIRNGLGNKVLWGEAEGMGLEGSRTRGGGSRVGFEERPG